MRLRGRQFERPAWLCVSDGKPDDDLYGAVDGAARFRSLSPKEKLVEDEDQHLAHAFRAIVIVMCARAPT